MHLICLFPMTMDDLEEVAALERACFSSPWSVEALSSELLKPQHPFYVARSNDRLAGYAGMQVVLDEGYITNIAVDSAFRRQGVGRLLVGQLAAYARQHTLSFITLEVRPGNTAAIALYTSAGFLQTGRRKNFYSRPAEDALLLTAYFRPQTHPISGS